MGKIPMVESRLGALCALLGEPSFISLVGFWHFLKLQRNDSSYGWRESSALFLCKMQQKVKLLVSYESDHSIRVHFTWFRDRSSCFCSIQCFDSLNMFCTSGPYDESSFFDSSWLTTLLVNWHLLAHVVYIITKVILPLSTTCTHYPIRASFLVSLY